VEGPAVRFFRHSTGWLISACLILAILLLLVSAQLHAQQPPIHFHDIRAQAGLHPAPPSTTIARYLVEMMGGGIALLDCDNDGKLDIAVVNDSTVDRYRAGGDPMITLYHQEAGLKFKDVTQESGLTTKGWGMGIAIADYNNDGLPDIYVTGYGHNVLYRNLGGCKFQDVTAETHTAGGGFSAGAAWADYDRDGDLDLFVSRYVDTDMDRLPKQGMPAFNYQGLDMEVPVSSGETDLLFHNRGGTAFDEVAKKAGVDNPDKKLGMGVIWSDYDHDGWPDLFVTNDMGPNFLYHNKHDGTFEDNGMISGVALSGEGRTMGNMAGDFADFDHTGRFGLIVTRYGYQPMTLYSNQGDGEFKDASWDAGLAQLKYQPVRWGVGFADFDNDGWPDILVANGNVTPLIDKLPNDLKYREPIQLFRNSEGRTFTEMANAAGLNDSPMQSRRGTAFGDIDNDGSVDVVVYNAGAPPSIFLNDTRNTNHRVLFKLVGTKSNREAVGARVSVTTAKMRQIDEVRAGGSYLSTNDSRLHFGLGSDAMMKEIEIEWPSGQKQQLTNIPADAIYTIEEGKGIIQTIHLPSLSK
jgi:enediyne biosynthesis protein E4